MTGNDPEFLEALRLIRKFFPESRAYLTDERGLDWDAFGGAMQCGDFAFDNSCDHFRFQDSPVLEFEGLGGLDGTPDEVYQRILSLAGFAPSGRAVVVPDAIGFGGRSIEECRPFVCAAARLPERLREIPRFWMDRHDTVIVFESGEAILVNHDDRLYWSRSRLRMANTGPKD